MVVRRRKKNVRQRGSHTHGWGSKKKHRGAGNRSGRGNAGRGKRSAHKKQWFIVRGITLGHRGFTMHRAAPRGKAINLEALARSLEAFAQSGTIRKVNDTYLIQPGAFPYAKILGSGSLHAKLHIESVQCSRKAVEKITAAGGKVTAAPASDNAGKAASMSAARSGAGQRSKAPRPREREVHKSTHVPSNG